MPDQPPIDDLFAFAPVKEEAAQPQAPQAAPSVGIGGRIADVIDSVNSGIGTAAHETVMAGASVVHKLVSTGEGLTNKIFGTESNLSGEAMAALKAEDASSRLADGSTYTPKTVVGGLAQPTAQFLTGMIGAGKALKGAEWFSKSGAVTQGFVTGAAADATVFAPNQDRLSNLFNEFADSHPALRNPLTEFLAAKPDDGEAVGRLKNAMEGVLAGGVIDRALAGMRGLKAIYYAKETKGNLAAEKVWTEQVLPELEAEHAKPVDEAAPKEAPLVPEAQPKILEPEVEAPELGIEKAARKQLERSHLTGDAYTKLAEESAVSETKQAQDILGPELGNIWTKKNLDETWIEKQIDAGRVPSIPPGTPYDQWWKKVEPLFMGDDVRELKKMADKIKTIESSQSADELGSFLGGQPLYDLMSALHSESLGKSLNFNESEAVTYYNTIQRTAAKNGWDLNEVNKGMYKASFEAGYKPEDIADLLGNTSERVAPRQGVELGQPKALEGATEKTLVAPAPKEAPKEAPLVPDDSANYQAGVQGPDAPLLAPAAKDRIISQLKDNPDWLSEGFVNTKGSGFNFTKMDSPDGAKVALGELAKHMPTPKTISFPEMVAEAKDMGVSVSDILHTGRIPRNQMAQTLLAGKALMQSTARQVADLARGIERNPGNKVELDKALQRFANVQSSVKALQSDAARATAAGRIRTADSFTPSELKAIQAAGGDLGAITKMISEPPLWVRLTNAHNQFWINSLLSGPTTHVRNIISNTIQTIALPAERIMGGVATGNIDAIKNGAHIALGLASSFKDALRLAVKASGLPDVARGARNGELLDSLKSTGNSILDPNNAKLSGNEMGRAISTESFPSLQGTHMGTVLDYFGEAANVPSRFLTSADEFFKQVNYRAQVHADAFIEGQKQGLKGKDLSEYIADRVVNSMTDEGAALNKRALEYAQNSTFTNKAAPGSLLSWLESGTTNHPYLKLVIPFVRTPANILKNAGLRTPGLNLLSKGYREALSGMHGAEAKADAVGKMMTGGALVGSAVTAALEGAITGKGPADPRERQTLLATGWQPYSFKVNGKYISFDGFDPMSMFFGIAGDYAEAAAHMDEAGRASAAGSFMVATVHNISSKTYLTGLTQVMDALTSPEKSGEAFIKSRAASYVPSGFKQLAGLIPGASDPYLRETRSVFDALLNRLPGFSQSLPPRRNMFGEAVTARQALGPDSISPFYYSEQKDDKAAEELARFRTVFAPPAQTIGNLDLTQFKNAKGQDFYDRQQEQLTTLRVGRYTLKEALEHLVTSERYAKWRENEPDAHVVGEDPRTLKEVRAVIVRYREEALRKTQQEYPEVKAAILNQKKAGRKADAGVAIPEALQQLLQINK